MFIEADTQTIVEQIGMGNVLAISGGRVTHRETGITLPVRYGYSVTVDLAAGDTYTVRRVFTRKGVSTIKGESADVYAEQVGEMAYRASCYRDPFGYEGSDPGEPNDMHLAERAVQEQPDAPSMREIAIERAGHVMTLIHDDQRSGRVPEAVASFAQLHDYVDANEYLIQTLAVMFADQRAAALAADAEVITSDAELDLANMISDIVDGRLHANALAVVASDDVPNTTREAFEIALAQRAADPQYASKPRLVEVAPPVRFVGVSDPDGGALVMPVFADDDSWAGRGYGTQDVSGAIGADGNVYSDADPGL